MLRDVTSLTLLVQITEFLESAPLLKKGRRGTLTDKEVGTIMRSSGQNPTEGELQNMTDKVHEDGSGAVHFTFLSQTDSATRNGAPADIRTCTSLSAKKEESVFMFCFTTKIADDQVHNHSPLVASQ